VKKFFQARLVGACLGFEGLRVQGAGCRVQGAGCRVQGAGCRVQGEGCSVKVEGYRLQEDTNQVNSVPAESAVGVHSCPASAPVVCQRLHARTLWFRVYGLGFRV
jgi:hypothetical protein